MGLFMAFLPYLGFVIYYLFGPQRELVEVVHTLKQVVCVKG